MTKLDGSALDSGLDGFGETAISRIQRVTCRLRSSCQRDWMMEWRLGGGTGESAALNEKGQIAWAKGRQAIELVTQIDVAKQIELMSPILSPIRLGAEDELVVRLGLTWWAKQAEVWVNGRLLQEGDLFDHTCRVLLDSGVAGGGVTGDEVGRDGAVEVRLKLVSPGHDGGALIRSRLILEAASGEADGGFVADEVAIVSKFLTAFYPDELGELADRLDGLALDGLEVLSEIRSVLGGWSDRIKQYKIQCLGHAHLDLAWLWTVDETWEVAERTFLSALNLMKDFPALVFGHTTPVMYEWFEEHRPDIFRSIQDRVQAGQWEPIGGLWVEPEINVIGGESIARQILYGQRYYEKAFGRRSRVAWLPDTFGFCGQLPQLLALGGMDYFVTQKLRWNDTTKVQYDVFNWQSPDGSQVLALMSAPIGEWIDPIKMSDYCWDFAMRSGLRSALYLPGVGDHGGGPTRDMLEIMQRWQKSEVFPTIEFTTAESFLDGVVNSIPVHHGELYLEFHRGCYTTHGDQKSFNRDCENALYEAELWASLAALTIGFNYPKKELEQAWKKTLFNQFHDILPGTSIRDVYPIANRVWEEVLIDTDCIINNAKDRIISAIAPLEPPHPDAQLIVVFNPNHWTRSQFVGFVIADSPANPLSWRWQLQTLDGQPLETEVKFRDSGERLACIIRSIVPDVPALGYACYWAVPVPGKGTSLPIVEAENYQLENEFLQVEINAETGDIHRIFDRQAQREVLQGDSNQLLSFKDDGQYWDAWNIDPNYKAHPLPAATLQSIRCIEKTNLRSRIEIVRTIKNSTFTQTYSLTQHSPILEIQNYIDWQEKHILVKAGFSFNLEADWVTYESACGIVDRTTRRETDAERAMWEVPGLRWASMSDGEYGVSLLCDRKHGYDHTPHEIRISLLRGSEFPDPIADRGIHEFTIGIYPHAGNWKTADTPKRSLELSLPMQAIVPNERLMQGRLPGIAKLLNLQAPTLMLMAIKQSEADRNKYILRGYEYQGECSVVTLETTPEIAPRLRLGDRLDLLENPLDGQQNEVQPWAIASFEVLVEDS